MPGKRLYRSVYNRVLAGVCGGLADYFDIDPIIVRLIFIIITIMGGGTGIILYLIGIFIIPKETELNNIDIDNRRSSNMSKSNQMLLYAGLIIILLGILISIDRLNIMIFPDYLHIVKLYFKKLFLPGLLILIGLYLIFEHKKRTEGEQDTMDYTNIDSKYNTKNKENKYSADKTNTQSKKLYRSLSDKKLTGLCGGIAEYFDVDSTLIRLLVVVIILSSGGFLGLITYFIASILIPTAPPKIDSHSFSSTSTENKNNPQKDTKSYNDDTENYNKDGGMQ